MKISIKNTNWAIAMSLLALGTTLSTSCSKQDKQEIVEEQGAKLIVKVTGVADDQGSLSTKGSNTTTILKPKVTSYSEFDAMTVVDNQLPASPMTLAVGNHRGSSSSNIGTKAGTINNNVKYTLFLFNPDGSLASSNPLTAGTSGSINVTPGVTYTWAALSYNNGEDVGVPAVGTTKIALNGGKDVLYASGSITIPTGGGSAPININFNRKFSRLAVEINTMGMFADMEDAKVEVTGQSVQTASINLANGNLSDFVDFPQTINYASFANSDPAYGDSKIAYIYTANNAKSEIKVAVSNLKIKLDDNSTRSFTTTANFNFTNITPAMGKSYRLLTNLMESPLTITRTSTLGATYTTQWARQNVYYKAGHNPYRFHHTYTKVADRNSFFSFSGDDPMKAGKNGDPCAKVYPAGVWKTATVTDYQMITGGGVLPNFLTGLTPTYNANYTEYPQSTGTASPYPSKNLRFYDNGQYINLNLVEDLISLSLGNTGQGHYWSGSAGIDLLGLVSVGALSYETANTGGGLIGNSPFHRTTFNIGSLKLLTNVDVVASNAKNVRCVRAQ